MKNLFRKGFTITLVIAVLCSMCACAYPYQFYFPLPAVDDLASVKLNYTIATKEEGIACRLSNEDYFNRCNREDLNFRMQKDYDMSQGVDEFKEFAAAQVLDFTDDEKALLGECMSRIEKTINEKGYVNIPIPENIWFIKTTMADEGGAGGYTHQFQIYLSEELIGMCTANKDDPAYQDYLDMLVWHEIFHTLTRNNRDFKRGIYSLIGAVVLDEEIPFPEEVSEKVLSNPDVDVYDSYIPLTINGELRNCVVFPRFTRSYEGEGDSFFDAIEPTLYPMDYDGELYSVDDASDFWDVFGKNTGYIIAIEETLADNFSFAVVYDYNDERYGFETPELLAKIEAYLKGEEIETAVQEDNIPETAKEEAVPEETEEAAPEEIEEVVPEETEDNED